MVNKFVATPSFCCANASTALTDALPILRFSFLLPQLRKNQTIKNPATAAIKPPLRSVPGDISSACAIMRCIPSGNNA